MGKNRKRPRIKVIKPINVNGDNGSSSTAYTNLPNIKRSSSSYRVQKAVSRGIQSWLSQTAKPSKSRLIKRKRRSQKVLETNSLEPWENNRPESHSSSKGIEDEAPIRSMQRRQQLGINPDIYGSPPPMMSIMQIQVSFLQVLMRLGVWIYAIVKFWTLIFWDWLQRKDSVERRAQRVRIILQSMGGIFIKLGQQMAMRVDLLPYPYCLELSKLLDKLPPETTKHAIQVIERVTQKPLADTFTQFDPEPIGSASIACVYQAVLHNGDKVAVKVRRANIGKLMMADWQALNWLLGIVELLAIVRPGTTTYLRADLREVILGELDFRHEARYQEVFRKTVKESKNSFINAPKVYFELLSEDLLVTEFASGVWLWEVLAAIEQKDKDALAYLESIDINPTIVAKRLAWANCWGNLENIIFHADPHPANIVIRPGNKLTFIDFGACGTMSEKTRRHSQRLNYCFINKNVRGMVQSAISVLEPLPPIDVDSFERELELIYWQVVFAFESKHAEWWERTSMTAWLGVMKLAGKYQIPVARDTLNLVRATLLYDTIVMRLDSKIDSIKLLTKYLKSMGKQSRKRIRKQSRNLFNQEQSYTQLEEWFRLADTARNRLEQFLDFPKYTFTSLVDKLSYAVSNIMWTVGFILIVGVVFAIAIAGIQNIQGDMLLQGELIRKVLSNRLYQGFMVAIAIISTRRIWFRVRDRSIRR
ncbi:AarF/ABC1/UbiB kinase family protein [Leptothoe sp. LEGE 181152]|nr:AarF/ABC1/UbiB kinase family protein [Leptothoe sp. LEGE 181152]